MTLLLEYFITCFRNHPTWNIPKYSSPSLLALGMHLIAGSLALSYIPSETLKFLRVEAVMLTSKKPSGFMLISFCICVLCYPSKYVFLSTFGLDGPDFPTHNTIRVQSTSLPGHVDWFRDRHTSQSQPKKFNTKAFVELVVWKKIKTSSVWACWWCSPEVFMNNFKGSGWARKEPRDRKAELTLRKKNQYESQRRPLCA